MQHRGDFGPHQLNNAGAGSDATLEQIAAQLYAARSAAIAETTESTQPSIKICSLIFIQHRA
jgi:hypothetical protein